MEYLIEFPFNKRIREVFNVDYKTSKLFDKDDYVKIDKALVTKLNVPFVSAGIDMPFMLDGNHRNTLMFVGLEPNRKECSEVQVGLSFGFDMKKCNNTIYKRIIDHCMSLNYNVYCTNWTKYYILNDKNKKTTYKDLDIKLIREEIEAIKPDFTIVLGSQKDKIELYEDLFLDRYYVFPHPSGANNAAWKNLVGKCTADNKLEYIISKISDII